jgi:hypothetical protein
VLLSDTPAIATTPRGWNRASEHGKAFLEILADAADGR